MSPYIDQENGAVRIAGTRVALVSVVAGFLQGEAPEKIAQEFERHAPPRSDAQPELFAHLAAARRQLESNRL